MRYVFASLLGVINGSSVLRYRHTALMAYGEGFHKEMELLLPNMEGILPYLKDEVENPEV